MSTITHPQEFPGTEEEAKANRATHFFFSFDEEPARCSDCDCRSSSVVADWPCGTDVPRVTVVR